MSVLPLYQATAPSDSRSSSPKGNHGPQSVTLTRKRTSGAGSALFHSAASHHKRNRSSRGGSSHLFSPPTGNDTWLHYLLSNGPLSALRLTQRARTTNLAVLLLILGLFGSLAYNLRFYLHEHPLAGERDRLPLSIRATLPQAQVLLQQKANAPIRGTQAGGDDAGSEGIVDLTKLDHLVLVSGHAVWKGRSKEEAYQPENWILESFQKDSVPTYIKHIMKGVEVAVSDPSSLLVFSGGQTRSTAQETEGDSYFRLADALDLYRQYGTPKVPLAPRSSIEQKRAESTRTATSKDKDDKANAPVAAQQVRLPFPRATSEQFALDSYQNLIFAICRFKEMTTRYPSRITVVGFEMKRMRFTEVHRSAVKFPLESFSYIGIDDDSDVAKLKAAISHGTVGELENGLLPYQKDIYGCRGSLLAKRRGRNPFRRIHPYFTSNALLRELLEYCPAEGTTVFPKRLPWEESIKLGKEGDR